MKSEMHILPMNEPGSKEALAAWAEIDRSTWARPQTEGRMETGDVWFRMAKAFANIDAEIAKAKSRAR